MELDMDASMLRLKLVYYMGFVRGIQYEEQYTDCVKGIYERYRYQ
jgi:hypothetical protein